MAAKSIQFTADEMEKGQFLRGNRRNLVEGLVLRNMSLFGTAAVECERVDTLLPCTL